MNKSDNKQNIMLVIRQREKILFEGEARAFTSTNDKGIFDVIYKHANFISLINKNYLIHNLDGSTKKVFIEEGIVRVHENKVTVFLGVMG